MIGAVPPDAVTALRGVVLAAVLIGAVAGSLGLVIGAEPPGTVAALPEVALAVLFGAMAEPSEVAESVEIRTGVVGGAAVVAPSTNR